MIAGVLVEVVRAVGQAEKEAMDLTFVKGTLKHVWDTEAAVWDKDGDGKMSKGEFFLFLRKHEVNHALDNIGVDPAGLVDFAEFLFQSDHPLAFDEFMEAILELRGSNAVKVADIVRLRKMMMYDLPTKISEALQDRDGRDAQPLARGKPAREESFVEVK